MSTLHWSLKQTVVPVIHSFVRLFISQDCLMVIKPSKCFPSILRWPMVLSNKCMSWLRSNYWQDLEATWIWRKKEEGPCAWKSKEHVLCVLGNGILEHCTQFLLAGFSEESGSPLWEQKAGLDGPLTTSCRSLSNEYLGLAYWIIIKCMHTPHPQLLIYSPT